MINETIKELREYIKEAREANKYHYWRGFIIGLTTISIFWIVVISIILTLIK